MSSSKLQPFCPRLNVLRPSIVNKARSRDIQLRNNHQETAVNLSPPWTKWPTFPRRHFQMHFHEWKFCILIRTSLKFVPNGPINNIPALVQIMACCLIGAKPLSEPILTQFTNAYTVVLIKFLPYSGATAQTRSAALWGVSGSYGQAPAQQGMSGLVRETSHLWLYSSPSPSMQPIRRESATSIPIVLLYIWMYHVGGHWIAVKYVQEQVNSQTSLS